LIVFGAGESLLFESAELTPGATILLRWRWRALLTPTEPGNWGRTEWCLARHFLVLPATTSMLASTVDYFGPNPKAPRQRERRRFSYKDLDLDHATTAELRQYLGGESYNWLCACALYPHVQWDITLQLGRRLDPSPLNEKNLERLVQLPWFRRGAIPIKLQQALAESLDKPTRLRLRAAILEVLEQASAFLPLESALGDAHRLEIAIQRLDILPKDRHKIQDDEAVARVVAEAEAPPLSIRISPDLGKVLFHHGLPSLGLRAPTRRAFAAVGILGLGGAALQWANEALKARTLIDPPVPHPPGFQPPSTDSISSPGTSGPITPKPSPRLPAGPNPNALPIVDPRGVAESLIANEKGIGDEMNILAKKIADSEQAKLRESLAAVTEALDKVSGGAPVIAAPENPVAATLQSVVAQKASEAGKVEMTDAGPIVKFSDLDTMPWIKAGFTKIFAGQTKYQWRTAPDDPDALKRDDGYLRIAVFGNWGTGAYGAPVIANSIRKDPDRFDVVLHLGNVYYSGQPEEIQKQLVDAFPYRFDALNRALCGNHEMYSGGQPYYDAITGGQFQQRATHFYVQNPNWLLVGLDTAYVDHDMPDGEVGWFSRVMAQAGDRKVVLFSHHQPFSLLDQQGPNLVYKLKNYLNDRRIFAWYWAHESRCVLYDQHPRLGLYGRCVGHGGFPYHRDILGPPSDKPTWKVLKGNDQSPGGRILDGANPYVKAAPKAYGPHGYISLIFTAGNMREFVHQADGTTIYTKSLTATGVADAPTR
jgi:hypothetical protein